MEQPMPTIDDIQDYLNRRGNAYRGLVSRIKNRLEEYHQYDQEGKAAIYRVASRADYQYGEEIKSAQGIYGKIRDKREVERRLSYGVQDVPDVVGVRVVCVYPSDVDRIISLLRRLRQEGFLRTCKPRPETTELGYRAWHAVVTVRGTRFMGLKCEIQVRTMLQEAWAHKAHPLIYKPKGAVSLEEERQAKLLSHLLDVVDQQSLLLEHQIRKARREEDTRKRTANLSYAKNLALLAGKKSARKQLRDILDAIHAKENELRFGEVASIIRQVESYVKRYGTDLDICRVMTYLATLRESDDLDAFVSDQIEACISKFSSKEPELCPALRFAGVFFHCIGDSGKAIQFTERGLRLAEELNILEQLHVLKANLAYFYAEAGLTEKAQQARKMAQEAVDANPANPLFLDTLGFVKIVFGQTYQEVLEGLQDCDKAYQTDTEKEVAYHYLALHRQKGHEKLMQLSAAELD